MFSGVNSSGWTASERPLHATHAGSVAVIGAPIISSIVRRLQILAVQFGIGLLALEVCLRLYNPLPFRVRGDRIVLPVRHASAFDNRDAPKLDPVTFITRNSIGFRGPDPPRDFTRRLTILTIGGSTTECLFLSDGKTWTDELARRLASSIPDVWVNNAGLDGQSTFGHLVLLRDFVVELRPKVALFLVGINDLALDGSNPYDASLAPHVSLVAAARKFIVYHSEIASLLVNLRRVQRARYSGASHNQWLDLPSASRLVLTADVMEATLNRHRQYLAGFTQRLGSIADRCRSNQIEPVFVTQPALYGAAIDPETGIDLAKVDVNGRENGALAWRLLEMYNDVTRRVASAKDLWLIDLAREMPKDSRLFYDFLHYTNAGAARVGEIVAIHLDPHLRGRSP